MNKLNWHIENLFLKLHYADYHRAAAIAYMENPQATTQLVGPTYHYERAIGAEFSAFMTTAHAALDLLAQTINASGLPSVEERGLGEVSLNRLINDLTDQPLKESLVELRLEASFLTEFTNTTKHRHVINSHDNDGTMYLESFGEQQDPNPNPKPKELRAVMREVHDGPMSRIREIAKLVREMARPYDLLESIDQSDEPICCIDPEGGSE